MTRLGLRLKFASGREEIVRLVAIAAAVGLGVGLLLTCLAGIHATDAHWAPIFARCAGPTVSLQERLQSARRAAFLRQNSGRVRQLEALAGQVVAAARGRG